MTVPSVTLSWDDPQSADEFLALCRDYQLQGWLGDNAVTALLELVGESRITVPDLPAGLAR